MQRQIKPYSKWLIAAVGTLFLTASAYADVILEIDLSVPNQITINATSAHASTHIQGLTSVGVYFFQFYSHSGSPLAASLVSSDLANTLNPVIQPPDLFRGESGSDPGLNLFGWNSGLSIFTVNDPAFTGSATWTLGSTEYTDMLAGGARSGEVFFPAKTLADFGPPPTPISIGQYRVVVPEPATLSLMVLGLGLGLRRSYR